ncbi:MAG: hypothetical protein U9N45_04235 [Gemmatimonadota bacterium]|nr:hypothetical protein [Gemmatimonadota bacterium]
MFIDEKGRLFGLVNLLDLVFIIGLAVICYVGLSVYLALKQPPLTITGIEPQEVAVGDGAAVNLSLKNERRLGSTYVRLIPHGFSGSTVQIEARATKRDRRMVSFGLPPDLAAGEYEIELETIASDVFNRKTLLVERIRNKYLTVKPMTRTQEIEGKTYWPVEIDVFIPPDRGDESVRLQAGDRLSDTTGSVLAEVISVRRSKAADTRFLYGKPWWKGRIPYSGGRTASMRLLVELTMLAEFQDDVLLTGNRFILQAEGDTLVCYFLGKGNLEPVPPKNMVSWDVEMILLIFNPEQQKAVVRGARQFGERGEVLAEVVNVAGEVVNPWIRGSADTTGVSSPKIEPRYIKTSMRLLCSLRYGRLYFEDTPVQPRALLRFSIAGQTISGNVFSEKPDYQKTASRDYVEIPFNVMLQMVPNEILPHLRPGVQAYDLNTRKATATILEVLEARPLKVPLAARYGREQDIETGFSQLLLRMSLNCTLVNGIPYFNSSALGYGGTYYLFIFSRNLECTIAFGERLPPVIKTAWIEAEVVFGNIAPNIAALLKAGEVDMAENGPSTMEIKSIVSNRPAQSVYPTSDGTLALSEHPLNRDIRCHVRLKVTKDGELINYRNGRLRLGRTLTFNSARWAASGVVVDFSGKSP